MACMLRISGDDFDVDSFIAVSEWHGLSSLRVYRKGEYVNELKKKVHNDYGFSICVSDDGYRDFERMQADAIAFLKKYTKSFQLLTQYKIENWHCLDFGLDTYPSNNFSKTYILSNELMRLAGEAGIDVWMSNYLTNEKSEE